MNDDPATYRVRLSPLAIDDLVSFHRWIVGEAGTPIANSYIDRIEARVATLAAYPHRGTPRDDLAAGLRTLAFERRLIIAYRVGDAVVDILRIIDGARELGPLVQ